MKKVYRLNILAAFWVVFAFLGVQAQEVKVDGFFNSYGTSAFQESKLVSSVGEPVIGMLNNGELHYLQGFVYKTLGTAIPTSIPFTGLAPISINIYPNPASDFINIGYPSEDYDRLRYSLFSEKGELIKTGLLTGQETQVSVAELVPAFYLLIVENTKLETTISRNKLMIMK